MKVEIPKKRAKRKAKRVVATSTEKVLRVEQTANAHYNKTEIFQAVEQIAKATGTPVPKTSNTDLLGVFAGGFCLGAILASETKTPFQIGLLTGLCIAGVYALSNS